MAEFLAKHLEGIGRALGAAGIAAAGALAIQAIGGLVSMFEKLIPQVIAAAAAETEFATATTAAATAAAEAKAAGGGGVVPAGTFGSGALGRGMSGAAVGATEGYAIYGDKGGAIGGAVGGAGGAWGGAAIGTAIEPGIGTAIGAILGPLIFGWGGASAGHFIEQKGIENAHNHPAAFDENGNPIPLSQLSTPGPVNVPVTATVTINGSDARKISELAAEALKREMNKQLPAQIADSQVRRQARGRAD